MLSEINIETNNHISKCENLKINKNKKKQKQWHPNK